MLKNWSFCCVFSLDIPAFELSPALRVILSTHIHSIVSAKSLHLIFFKKIRGPTWRIHWKYSFGEKEERKKEWNKERKKKEKKETSSHYTSSWGRREEAFIRLTIIFSFNHLCSFQIKKEILIKGLEDPEVPSGVIWTSHLFGRDSLSPSDGYAFSIINYF